MLNSTNLKISKKHLTSRIKQTVVAMLSVIFGTSMYIFMNGFMTGINETQDEMAFSQLAHIRIYNDVPEDNTNLLTVSYPDAIHNVRNPQVIKYTNGIKNSGEIIEYVEKIPEVDAVAPQVNLSIFFQKGAMERNGTISGIDSEKEEQLFNVSSYVVEGSWESFEQDANTILLGVGVAKNFSLDVGDYLLVKNSNGVSKNFKIAGLFETTLTSTDNAKGYVSIAAAQQLASENSSYASDIQINITDYSKAQVIADYLDRSIPYKVESWIESNGQLVAGNELRNIMAIAVSLTILLVAGFGIYNIMTMTVNEKIREIAILKAVGYDERDIVEIFLTQSIIIGLLGGLFGMVFGFLISMTVSIVPFEMPGMSTLPVTYYPRHYVLSFLFGVITTALAGYLPAKKASNVDPVEIIRG
ncbi:MAG: ABC transporter permease [Balneola sp.]|nr:MAG: ABC transporter permease [Balneola sp.]